MGAYGREWRGRVQLSLFEKIFEYAPLFVAPLVLLMFSLVSAYVLKFNLPKSGLSFDYIVFTLLIAVALIAGGAI